MLRLEISSSLCACFSLRSSRSLSISAARSSLAVRSRSRRSRFPARLSRFSSRFERRRSVPCTSRRRSRSSPSASLILDSPLDTVRLASSRASRIRRRSSERASSTTFEASFFAVSMRLPETLLQTKKKPNAPKPTPNRPDRTASRTTIGASMRSPPYQFRHLAELGNVLSWYVRSSILSSRLRALYGRERLREAVDEHRLSCGNGIAFDSTGRVRGKARPPCRQNARGSRLSMLGVRLLAGAAHQPDAWVHDHQHQVGDENADDRQRREQQEDAPREVHVLLLERVEHERA